MNKKNIKRVIRLLKKFRISNQGYQGYSGVLGLLEIPEECRQSQQPIGGILNIDHMMRQTLRHLCFTKQHPHTHTQIHKSTKKKHVKIFCTTFRILLNMVIRAIRGFTLCSPCSPAVFNAANVGSNDGVIEQSIRTYLYIYLKKNKKQRENRG